MRVNNEKGYALVLVLVIITITFTLALSMSGMALSARKQFNKTDELSKATDLAEMGVAHYEALLAKIVFQSNAYAESAVASNNGNGNSENNGKKNRSLPEYDVYFLQTLKTTINQSNYKNVSGVVEGSNSYDITLLSVSEIQFDRSILVSFISEGKTGKESKTLKTTVRIEKNGTTLVGDPKPATGDYTLQHKEAINLKGQDKHLTFDSSTYFEKNIQIQGNRVLTVNGNAFFKEQITFLGTADIIVNGDAIFMVPPNFNGQSYSFCVYGNAYLVDSQGNLTEYADFPSGKNKSCPRPLDDEWYINPDEGVEVEY